MLCRNLILSSGRSVFTVILLSSLFHNLCASFFARSKSQCGSSACIFSNAPAELTGDNANFILIFSPSVVLKSKYILQLSASSFWKIFPLVKLPPETFIHLWLVITVAVLIKRF